MSLGKNSRRSSLEEVRDYSACWDHDASSVEWEWRSAEVLKVAVYRHPCQQTRCPGRGKRIFYGECLFNVDALHMAQRRTGKRHVAEVSLYHGVELCEGCVSVDITVGQWEESTGPADGAHECHVPLQPVLAHLNKNTMLGIFHNIRSLEASTHGFITFTVLLQGVPDIFGDVESHGKDGSHKFLFSESWSVSVVRDFFKLHHRFVYSQRLAEMQWSLFPGKRVRSGAYFLRSGDDFLCLLHHGNKHGKARVFTYSLVDRGLFFSETNSTPLKDTNSKHIVHAGANMSVRCAGTLRICRRPDRRFVLVFDNESGTYMPGLRSLELMRDVLAKNFPDLETMGLDFMQEQPSETLTWSGPNEVNRSIYKGKWRWQPE